jgi:hypothetical protein
MKIYENLDINNLEGEFWKVIKNFPDYLVSNFGRIKSFKKCRGICCKILKQNKNKDGYLKIGLFNNNNKRKTIYIHRLIYETFKEKLKKDYDIHHVDENKENNFVDNLESKFHPIHSYNHNPKGNYIGKNNPMFGIKRSGEKSGNHKLTNLKIIQIKMLFKLNFKNIEISKIYNISSNMISNIRTEKYWNHIKV